MYKSKLLRTSAIVLTFSASFVTVTQDIKAVTHEAEIPRTSYRVFAPDSSLLTMEINKQIGLKGPLRTGHVISAPDSAAPNGRTWQITIQRLNAEEAQQPFHGVSSVPLPIHKFPCESTEGTGKMDLVALYNIKDSDGRSKYAMSASSREGQPAYRVLSCDPGNAWTLRETGF